MSFAADKYRGTPLYHQVFAELVTAAGFRGTVLYGEVAQIMGLPPAGSHMGKETGQILGEISEDEVNQDRPMLSAVAVGTSGIPGPGFFDFARKLGKQFDDSPEGRKRFWRAETKAVYEAWKRRLGSST